MHGVDGLRRGVGRALAAGLDLRQAGAFEDLAKTLAPRFVVAAEQTAAARDHACVARAE